MKPFVKNYSQLLITCSFPLLAFLVALFYFVNLKYKYYFQLRPTRFLLLLFSILCITGCDKCSQTEPKPIVLVSKPEMINEEVSKLLSEKLADHDTSKILIVSKDSLIATKFVIDFYAQKKYEITWSDKGKLNKQGDSLFQLLGNAVEYGLIASDYHFLLIDSLLRTAHDTVAKKYDAVKIANADLLLTDAFFKFIVHVSKGRIDADSLCTVWKASMIDTSLVDVLNSAFKKNTIRATAESFEPKNEQYQALKLQLKNYKYEFKDSTWEGLATRESDSTTFTARLKKRLIASHDYFDEFTGNDSIKLLKSVKNFQCKHNLVEDGKIGKLTFKALQQTKDDVIHQIEMNMERWRWKDAPTEKRYVWVNIPKFEMHVTEDDTLVMRSRVIIGETDHQTPLLKSTIGNFLIYPYWNVPFSIATKELLPILKRDSSYLRRKNFDVLDANGRVVDPKTIKWKKYTKTYFPWRLRQKTGDDNSLGILKFNFNNKYGVYMHDTDNHRLFGREMRALSHGCVRLEKFIDFASFLIRDDSVKYPKDSLMMDLLVEKQKYVYIKHPIALYINYYTVEVDEYGELHFFNDVYARDEKMLRGLYKK